MLLVLIFDCVFCAEGVEKSSVLLDMNGTVLLEAIMVLE